jgi:hypothetical protein
MDSEGLCHQRPQRGRVCVNTLFNATACYIAVTLHQKHQLSTLGMQ